MFAANSSVAVGERRYIQLIGRDNSGDISKLETFVLDGDTRKVSGIKLSDCEATPDYDRLNLFLIYVVWFRRANTFGCSRPDDDGAGSILDCGERSYLSLFSSKFVFSDLNVGGRIGDLCELSFAGDFLFFGEVVCVLTLGFVCAFILIVSLAFSLFAPTVLGCVWSSAEGRFFSCSWNFGQSLGFNWISFSTRALYFSS